MLQLKVLSMSNKFLLVTTSAIAVTIINTVLIGKKFDELNYYKQNNLEEIKKAENRYDYFVDCIEFKSKETISWNTNLENVIDYCDKEVSVKVYGKNLGNLKSDNSGY